MEIKKVFVLFLAIFSILTITSVFVSAQNLPAPSILASSELKGIMESIFVGSTSSGEDIVARILVFLLVTLVLTRPAKMVLGDSKFGGVVAILVGMMSVRFLTPDIIRGLFLPNQALAIGLSILLPFILFEGLLLSSDIPKQFRMIGHSLLAGIFLAMWFLRWEQLGDLSYYYLIGVGVVFIVMWGDKEFRVWMAQNRIGNAKKSAALLSAIDKTEDLKIAMDRLVDAKGQGNRERIREAENEVKGLSRAIAELERMY